MANMSIAKSAPSGKSAFLSKLDGEQQKMTLNAFEKESFTTGANIITQGDEPCGLTRHHGPCVVIMLIGDEGDYFYMLDTGSADVFVSKPEWPEPKKVNSSMARIVMAYIGMADVVMTYIVMA